VPSAGQTLQGRSQGRRNMTRRQKRGLKAPGAPFQARVEASVTRLDLGAQGSALRCALGRVCPSDHDPFDCMHTGGGPLGLGEPDPSCPASLRLPALLGFGPPKL
jgi:hypothetical protein